jgi:hypothetical protein
MGFPIPKIRFRARSLFLSGMIFVIAVLLWRGGRNQKESSVDAVATWVKEAVRTSQGDRGQTPVLGSTQPIVARTFADWIWAAVPANAAGDPAITVTALDTGFFGNQDSIATHRAVVVLLGKRADVEVQWSERADGSWGGAIVGFTSAAPIAGDPAAAPR